MTSPAGLRMLKRPDNDNRPAPTLEICQELATAAGHPLSPHALHLAAEDLRSGEVGDCDQCHRLWPTTLLDGKRAGGVRDFTRLEGPCCYGPAWSEM